MDELRRVRDIIQGDSYQIRNYDKDAFDYIIDIGSNVGQFSFIAHVLFSNAKIFAYEPCDKSYEVMCISLKGIPNLTLIHKALGNGEPLYFRESGGVLETCTGHLFKEKNTGNYKIDSVTLDKIFEENKIDLKKKILLKIDCEGGEQYLLNNKYNNILLECEHISFEAHFPCTKYDNFDDLPTWETYNNWVKEVFTSTYNILYHILNIFY